MRNTEGYEAFSGIVCPRCFGELAREQGVADYFCLTTHDAKVPLPSVFGDGRVWDAAQCMWVEAEARQQDSSALRDEVEAILDRIPFESNETWWASSSWPRRRIRGMFAPLLAALAALPPSAPPALEVERLRDLLLTDDLLTSNRMVSERIRQRLDEYARLEPER